MNIPTVEEIRQTEVFSMFAESMRKILGEVAGWAPQRVDDKIDSMLDNDGFRSWFLHDSPAYFAAELIIPDNLEGLPFVKLRSQICHAIESAGEERCLFPHTKPDYDWESVRKKVANLLSNPN